MALLEASGIGKNFGDTKVLKDISLTLEQGEALAIIGSSGSGKTTLLRCLNFLERPDTPPPSGKARSAKSGCTSGWCSRTLTSSRSIRRCRT